LAPPCDDTLVLLHSLERRRRYRFVIAIVVIVPPVEHVERSTWAADELDRVTGIGELKFSGTRFVAVTRRAIASVALVLQLQHNFNVLSDPLYGHHLTGDD
jgi:hypothetical protein